MKISLLFMVSFNFLNTSQQLKEKQITAKKGSKIAIDCQSIGRSVDSFISQCFLFFPVLSMCCFKCIIWFCWIISLRIEKILFLFFSFTFFSLTFKKKKKIAKKLFGIKILLIGQFLPFSFSILFFLYLLIK